MAARLPRLSQRLRWPRVSTRTPTHPTPVDLNLAEVTLIAAQRGQVLVPRAEYEQMCAKLASLSAAVAEADGEFDKILYQ